MLSLLYTGVMFIIAISILVAVHEFGHFWVAKRLGVKVLRYSIGIGKPIWTWRAGKDQIEYAISALPLGGYVKMLDEREGDVTEEDLPRAFNRQKVWKRFAIVVAGPLFNFIFAIFAYWMLFVVGVNGIKPVIAEIIPNTPAASAGISPGGEIISVNGNVTPSWEEVMMQLWPVLVDKDPLTITVKPENAFTKEYSLDIEALKLERDLQDPIKAVGISPFGRIAIPPTIDKVVTGMPAAQAGLKSGDRIVKFNDVAINDWNEITPYLQKHCSEPITITYERDGKLNTTQFTTKIETQNGVARAMLGISPKIPEIAEKDKPLPVVYALSPWHALVRAVERTGDMSLMSMKLLGKIVTLEFSFRNIGGVVQIASAAGRSASMGYERFMMFLALVSISLGIMNLLPVPVLDGGHLLFYVIEIFTGKPVSERVEMIGQKIGIMLLMLLMMLAFYNDIMRMIVPGYGLDECPRF